MQPSEYAQLRNYEGWHWWYTAQRMNLATALRELNLPRGARVLDAGCGSGATLEELAGKLGLIGHGMDVSEHATALWKRSAGGSRCRASVNAMPYAKESFDAVYSVDVLGCSGVDQKAAMTEMARVVRPGGAMVLLVPAYQWLLSTHDAAVHSVHRFTRAELADLVRRAGFEVVRLTHRFPLFFPAIATVRMVRRLTRSAELGVDAHCRAFGLVSTARIAVGSAPVCVPANAAGSLDFEISRSARSDLRPIPKWLNGLLLAAARFEHRVVRGWDVPFGSTILLTARKVRS